MTIAVCFNCGNIKFGAFSECDKCNKIPETHKEKALSMVLTDHFHNEEKLKYFGKSISEGIIIKLEKETEERWLNFFRDQEE